MWRSTKSGRPIPGAWLTRVPFAAALMASTCVYADSACTSDDPRPDEVAAFAESVSSPGQPGSSAWGISYRKTFLPCFAASMAYLNDGHFIGHHRDGVALEGWIPIDFHLFWMPAAVSVGGGPFYYYDTVFAPPSSGGYADAHAWTWIWSGDLILQPLRGEPWSHLVIEARIDHTSPAHDIQTTSFGIGIGYRGISDFDRGEKTDGGPLPSNEVVAAYYKTVTNSLNSGSEQAPAEEIEYLWRFHGEFALSAGFLNEGDTQLIRRNGALAEAWAEPTFGSGLFSIGAGFGFYSAIDKYRPSPGRHVSDVVSATVSLRLPKNFAARFIWHRIVTDYNRDTDVVLWGLAYRF
jgi:hypothetical protein